MNEKLQRLLSARADRQAARSKILAAVEARGAQRLTNAETEKFQAITADLRELDDHIAQTRDDIARSGRENPETVEILRASTTTRREDWATRAFDAIKKLGGSEDRSYLASGSVDVPRLIDPAVTAIARPKRLIDLLVNRKALQSNGFEYFRQSVRTNNATAVADLGTKPTSVFTIVPVTDRARVIAHISEQVPVRLWQDATDVVNWLRSEMVEGVLDAVESQVISGDATGENLEGILEVSGTTAVAFNTDVPTTLRKAITALQVAGEQPNAWVLNPADAESIDLAVEATGGVGYLHQGGYTNSLAGSNNIFGDGITRVVSNSVPSGTAILADWSMAQIQVREDVRVDIDTGGDNFAINTATLRAETRLGLAHLRPAAFAIVDLTA